MIDYLRHRITTMRARTVRLGARLRGEPQPPVILMYHRIASPSVDPWGLAVGPDLFRAQMAMVHERFSPVSMEELVHGLAHGKLPPRAVAVTFDDGYADNARVAAPALKAAGVPATVFLTTGAIGRDSLFWWDELADWVLEGRRAADFRIELEAGNGPPMVLAGRWDEQAGTDPRLATWRAGVTAPPTARAAAFLDLWARLQALLPEPRARAMALLRAEIGEDLPGVQDLGRLPMTCAEATGLARFGVSLGGHTRDHTPLPALPPHERDVQIGGSLADLRALGLYRPGNTGFAYPHGERDAPAVEHVRLAGYAWAVTTQCHAIPVKGCDPMALPRLAVDNWSPATLERRITGLPVAPAA